MSIPISAGSTLVGVLTLYADTPDAFTVDQRRLVQMVAPHLGGAIQAARAAASTRPVVPMERARELRLVANH
jgi:GAF domain-containing protein